MAENYGKKFEQIVKESFEKVDGVSIDRLHDQMSGFSGSKNICDFIVYKKPYEIYIECKSTRGNTLTFSNITQNQWTGLLEKSKIKGVKAGVLIWFIDRDVTMFAPIQFLQYMKESGLKSIRPDPFVLPLYKVIYIEGKKKRVFYDYDFTNFFEEVAEL